MAARDGPPGPGFSVQRRELAVMATEFSRLETRALAHSPDGYNSSVMATNAPPGALDVLLREFFQRGVRYCVPAAKLTRIGSSEPAIAQLTVTPRDAGTLELSWLGGAYLLELQGRAPTVNEVKLLHSIGRVLSARHRVLLDGSVTAERLDLFRGFLEDRFVSGYLDPSLYVRGGPPGVDRVAE